LAGASIESELKVPAGFAGTKETSGARRNATDGSGEDAAVPSQGAAQSMDDTLLGRFVFRLAAGLAIAAGSVLAVVTVTTVVSVIGRSLIAFGLKPVPGDYEIVQAGVLFAIFCSLPLTQYLRGHADVALLTDRFPTRAAAAVELVMDALMLMATAFILWRYGAGMLDKFANKEVTLILHIPVWSLYAVSMLGAVGVVVVAAYCLVRSLLNTVSRAPHKPEPGIF
jgi:TRAP-type C4-dicarboxylate transport system permease small subunit